MATHPMRGIEVLIRLSSLENVEHARSCIDTDRRLVDLERLDDWSYSSGEQVLVDLVRSIYNGTGGSRIHDLTALDDHNRRVALIALESWLVDDDGPTS